MNFTPNTLSLGIYLSNMIFIISLFVYGNLPNGIVQDIFFFLILFLIISSFVMSKVLYQKSKYIPWYMISYEKGTEVKVLLSNKVFGTNVRNADKLVWFPAKVLEAVEGQYKVLVELKASDRSEIVLVKPDQILLKQVWRLYGISLYRAREMMKREIREEKERQEREK